MQLRFKLAMALGNRVLAVAQLTPPFHAAEGKTISDREFCRNFLLASQY